MLLEKEVLSPGQYFYIDEKSGIPRKWTVTAETIKQLHKDGNEMVALGLPIPVPYEHDFSAHPMTPKEKLVNNAGEVKEYRLKGDTLFSLVDIQDEDVKKKVGKSIRWTSPWISSFTDGSGRQWNNVIAHLALTTRPRVTKQAPFQSISAALSLATESLLTAAKDGFCISRAGRVVTRKKDKKVFPQYPMAFSMWAGGIKLAEEDMPPLKKKKKEGEGESKEGSSSGEHEHEDEFEGGGEIEEHHGKDGESEHGEEEHADITGLMNPLMDQRGDVKMEELLCDLLSALGVMMPENVGEAEFKRALYEAAMSKIKELAAKGQAAGDANAAAAGANTTSPAGQNPLTPGVQQEQQPMYMSLEEINKIPDPTMKGIALSMYNENVKLRAEADADRKKLNSLNDAKLKEENAKRQTRVQMLGKLSPKVKTDLDAMIALPSMALSMGEGGAVVDPMAQTLAVLEKGLSDMPRLLTTDRAAFAEIPQPTDADALTPERENEIADNMARQMGYPPERAEKKKAS